MDGSETPQNAFIRSRGLRFPLREDLIPPRTRKQIRQRTYEEREMTAALANVRKGDTVLELGGGLGYMSTILAKKRALKHIHVFEANPVLVDYIKETHAINGIDNATVHGAVLGKRKGSAEFYVRKVFNASSLDPLDGKDVVHTEHVEVRNAKQAMKEIKPDVLICDIEGAEVDVIPLLDLSKIRSAVVELHPQWIGVEGVNTVFRAFMDAGLAYAARQSNRKVVSFRRSWPLR